MNGSGNRRWMLTIACALGSAILVEAAEGPGGASADKSPPNGGTEQPGVMLGDKFVPRDKFLVFFLFGDSNTDGTGFQWHKDDWRSERAWHFSGRDKKWLPAQPGTPHSIDSKLNPPWGSVGFPFVKKLTQTYPDYYFGIVKATHGGSPFGFGDYDKYLGLLLQHGGKFIAQGVITEGQFDKKLYERLCKDFDNTLDRFAFLANYQRYERTCQGWCEFRATPEMLADVRVFTAELTVDQVKQGRLPDENKDIVLVIYGWKDRTRMAAADWKAGQKLENLALKSWDAQPDALKRQAMDDTILDLERPWFLVEAGK